MSDYDVIIIGSGAGGGTLARHLAPSGKKILMLERGGWLPREPRNWSAGEVFVENRYVSPDTWYDGTASRSSHRCTTTSAARRSSTARRCTGCAKRTSASSGTTAGSHPPGRSPTRRWSPTTARPSSCYEVHGARGEDPTEPPASAPYPFPAVSHEPRIQQLSDDFAAAGLHPFHAPCGVMLNEANMPYSTCVRCSTCDGFPCLVHAKSDAEVLGVRPALEHENVTLLTHAEAVALSTNSAGTAVTEVVVERDGAKETYSADIVVISAGAANTAKLLLASANDKHPGGLANGSDQVGRNYMFHDSQAVLALSKEPNDTVFQKTLGVNDYYFAGEEWEFPMGNIQMVGKSVADMYRGEQPLMTKLAPTFSLKDVAEHAIDFWLSTEDLPLPENRVNLDGDGNVVLNYKSTNDGARDRLLEQLRSLLGHLGMQEHHLIPRWAYLENKIPVAGVAHQAGTCRFGSDPATSALNTDCRAHELDNLYVVDTSFFPSIAAVNPALTAMANAVRVGDHLLERLGANGG